MNDTDRSRGNKQLIGSVAIALSLLMSTFWIGRDIQKLVDGLTVVTSQHQQLLDMKPCRQN